MPATDSQPSDGEPAPELVLFVCVANVCRSPTMQFLTSKALESAGLGKSWEFASAGTAVASEERMCRTSGTALGEYPGGAGFSRRHRSRALSPELVERAGLILVASHRERAAVARLSAPARERTFTMIEAALLVESASREPSRWHNREQLTLRRLVDVMHDNRGTAARRGPDNMVGRLLPRSRRPTTVDIRDVHSGEVRSHGPVLEDLRWASSHLAGSLVRLAQSNDG